MSKGSSPRPFTNYSGYLEQMDKIFGFNEFTFNSEDLFKYTTVCSHTISKDSMTCKYCGQSTMEINNKGDSYILEN